jgi:nicotinamide phosphoribosyltransferase
MVEITINTIQKLWEVFGGTINEAGYKVLDPHIGLI